MNAHKTYTARITARGADSTIPDNATAVDASIYLAGKHIGSVTLLEDHWGDLVVWGDELHCWADSQIMEHLDTNPETVLRASTIGLIVDAVRVGADRVERRMTFDQTCGHCGNTDVKDGRTGFPVCAGCECHGCDTPQSEEFSDDCGACLGARDARIAGELKSTINRKLALIEGHKQDGAELHNQVRWIRAAVNAGRWYDLEGVLELEQIESLCNTAPADPKDIWGADV